MDLASKIYVAGHRGLVGSAIVRRLTALNWICGTKRRLSRSVGTGRGRIRTMEGADRDE